MVAATFDQVQHWVIIPAARCVCKLYGTLSAVLLSLVAHQNIPPHLSDLCTPTLSHDHRSPAHIGRVVLPLSQGLVALVGEALAFLTCIVEVRMRRQAQPTMV